MSKKNPKSAANIEVSEETKAPQVETMDEAQELINQLIAENSVLKGTVVELSEQLEKAKKLGEKAGVRVLTDSKGNQCAMLVGAIQVKGQKLTYEMLKTMPETVSALLESGSGAFKKL